MLFCDLKVFIIFLFFVFASLNVIFFFFFTLAVMKTRIKMFFLDKPLDA